MGLGVVSNSAYTLFTERHVITDQSKVFRLVPAARCRKAQRASASSETDLNSGLDQRSSTLRAQCETC